MANSDSKRPVVSLRVDQDVPKDLARLTEDHPSIPRAVFMRVALQYGLKLLLDDPGLVLKKARSGPGGDPVQRPLPKQDGPYDLPEEGRAFHRYCHMERVQMKRSPYASTREMGDWLSELKDEVGEAMGSWSDENLAEELGDILCDTVHCILQAEKDGITTMEDTIRRAHEKILRRKPWLLDGPAPATIEEEMEIWNEAKAKEPKNAVRRCPSCLCDVTVDADQIHPNRCPRCGCGWVNPAVRKALTDEQIDAELPWECPLHIYESDGPASEETFEVYGIRFNVRPAAGWEGSITGRKCYRVDCLTCDKTLHVATTGPSPRIRDHFKEEHT